MADEIPEDAEKIAVLDALRQSYALVAAQRRFIPGVITGLVLDQALSAIAALAASVKGETKDA